MHLIQVLLPLSDNQGQAFAAAELADVRRFLTETFGGLTAFSRAPAEGLWKDGDAPVAQDDILILEILTDDLDRGWWQDYRRQLEQRFRQDLIIIRVQTIELL